MEMLIYNFARVQWLKTGLKIMALLLLTFPLPTAAETGTSCHCEDSVRSQFSKSQTLFESDEVIPMTIITDLKHLLSDSEETDMEYLGEILIPSESGRQDKVLTKIKARGKTRLKKTVCDFPPLKLDFGRIKTKNTLFSKQKSLKLVTHCQSGETNYEQYLFQEYLAYKMYNLISPYSFRVRLVQITYRDVRGEVDPISTYAFLIEDDDALAYRNCMQKQSEQNIKQENTERWETGKMLMFQYLIGNNDWSVPALHNIKLLNGSKHKTIPVPYDFDFAGYIYTPYNQESKKLGADRNFRGYSRSQEELDSLIVFFNQKQNAVRQLINEFPLLKRSYRNEMLNYVAKFFEIINDNKQIERAFIKPFKS